VKKKTEQLHTANRYLSAQAELFDLAHDAIITHDLDGKINFWNQGAETTYGWKKEDVFEKFVHQLLHTDPAHFYTEIINGILVNGSWQGELIHTTRDGRKITVESRWALQKDESGEPVGILEINRDVTGRKTAERQSQEAHRFAESIIETIQEALVVLDAELKVVSANKSFYALFGLTPKETENRYIYELDRRQWDIPQLRNLLEDILPQNTTFREYEMEHVSSKGDSRVLLLNARQIHRERKKTQMILLAMQDITQLKRRQQEVRELTEQLLIAEEEQRQQIAVELHDSIGQILAFSNRELASIIKKAEPETAKLLRHVKQELARAVRQSRELSTDLSSATLNMFGLEAGVEELTERFSEKHDIACRYHFHGTAKSISKKIELAFYQASRELLHNIAKHAHADRAQVELNMSDGLLELSVSDNGKGFDTSALENGDPGKHGFGLYSIRQRLTNLGGLFNIKSSKQTGTTVTLQVPLTQQNTKESS